VLLINGTKDLRVNVSEAELLKKAKPEAKLEIIENMSHIFKEIKGDDSENMKSYSDSNLLVTEKLVTAINLFIKSL
jgi:hypothetical protein